LPLRRSLRNNGSCQQMTSWQAFVDTQLLANNMCGGACIISGLDAVPWAISPDFMVRVRLTVLSLYESLRVCGYIMHSRGATMRMLCRRTGPKRSNTLTKGPT
jgi:hypothetical protein